MASSFPSSSSSLLLCTAAGEALCLTLRGGGSSGEDATGGASGSQEVPHAQQSHQPQAQNAQQQQPHMQDRHDSTATGGMLLAVEACEWRPTVSSREGWPQGGCGPARALAAVQGRGAGSGPGPGGCVVVWAEEAGDVLLVRLGRRGQRQGGVCRRAQGQQGLASQASPSYRRRSGPAVAGAAGVGAASALPLHTAAAGGPATGAGPSSHPLSPVAIRGAGASPPMQMKGRGGAGSSGEGASGLHLRLAGRVRQPRPMTDFVVSETEVVPGRSRLLQVGVRLAGTHYPAVTGRRKAGFCLSILQISAVAWCCCGLCASQVPLLWCGELRRPPCAAAGRGPGIWTASRCRSDGRGMDRWRRLRRWRGGWRRRGPSAAAAGAAWRGGGAGGGGTASLWAHANR